MTIPQLVRLGRAERDVANEREEASKRDDGEPHGPPMREEVETGGDMPAPAAPPPKMMRIEDMGKLGWQDE